MKFITPNNILRGILYLTISVFVLWTGVITEPDTGSYVHLTLIAPPAYASFLFVLRKLLGEDSYFYYVVIIQLVVCVSTTFYFIKVLQRIFNIRESLLILLDIILLSPLFITEYLVGNRITTEGLGYSCFLLILAFFFRFIMGKHKKSQWFFLITLFIGILIRTQFFFLLPVITIVLIYFWFKTKDFKQFGVPLLTVFMLPILISLVDRTYHYAVTGYFVNTSNTGVQLMSMPMFVADADDYKIYDDPKKQEYFKYVYKGAVDRKVTKEFYVSNKLNDTEYRHFHDNYAHLSFGVLSIKGREFLNPSNPGHWETLIENNKLLISMWLPLLYDNFSKCIHLFYRNVIHAFGGFYMLFLNLLILILSIVLFIKHRQNLSLFSSVLMLYTFCNVVLVCLVEHSISRFFMYSHWILPVLFILLINKYVFGLKDIGQ